MITSSRKDGNHEYRVASNLTDRVWSGFKLVQLYPQQAVNCVLTWQDTYTNGQFLFHYLPEPNLIQRAYEKISVAMTRQSTHTHDAVSLTGAPWTNAPGRRWPR